MDQQHVLNCIIIDDDELDLLSLQTHIRPYPFLHIIGAFASAEQAAGFIESHRPDILFSDIDMPGLNGIALRREWLDIPVCVFVTSYPDYAAECFEVSAFDFIVKPLNEERFDTTVKRIEQYFSILKKAERYDASVIDGDFFIKEGHREIKIPASQIVYLEALKDYTAVVTTQKKYLVLSTIGNLLKEKPFNSFVRVHRSFAVHPPFVDSIAPQEVIANKTKLPVGRVYKANLKTLSK